MSTYNLITAGIFLAAIGVESYLNAKNELDHYDNDETKTNIIIALIGVTVNLLVQGTLLTYFFWLKEYAVFNVGLGWTAWIICFVLVDLQSYLFHVLGHKSRFFWAMHVIHHSAQKYNYTTAIRTPFTNSFFRFTSLAPIVLLGFDPVMVVLLNSINASFAFFQHTEMIKKLGWLEYILSTPSHHRVHHASNEKYIDKNYGAFLILWDKLFGTFKAEEERPVYGLTKPLKDTRVFNVITHEWRAIMKDVWNEPNWIYKLRYIFGNPGWTPTSKTQSKTISVKNGSADLTGRIAFSILVLLISHVTIQANSISEILRQGIAYEKKHDDRKALDYYEQILKVNPNHTEALWRASRMLCNLGGRSGSTEIKKWNALKAKTYVKRSIELDPDCKEAHLCYIISLGQLSEVAPNPKDKLENAKIIYDEAQKVLSIDSMNAPAFYILGKWHLELAKLNWAERLACNLLFGGIPSGASFDKSLYYFRRAIQLEPNFILFRYGMATAYFYKENYDQAIHALEKALAISPVEPDDILRLEKCRKMLDESRSIYTKH